MIDRGKLACLCRSADAFGAAHVVISDLNVDDHNLRVLLNDATATADEREIAHGLLEMPEDMREDFLIACGC